MLATAVTTPGRALTQSQSISAGVRSAIGDVTSIGTSTLLFASGRGGSGTTLLATLCAAAAAGDGKRVLLIDTDDIVGPISLLLGVTPLATWPLLRSATVNAKSVVTPISETLSLIAGGVPSGFELQPLGAAERRAAMRRLESLFESYDIIVADCGSKADSVASMIVPHLNERLIAVTGSADAVTLAATYALTKLARQRHPSLPSEILVNRQGESDARGIFDVLDAGARQFLGTPLSFAGVVPDDRTLDAALRAGMPFWDAATGSPAALAAHYAVTQIATRAASSLSLPRAGS